MTDAAIDYAAVFQALPGMAALLTPELHYADANEAYLRATGRTREHLIGRCLFDVFPDNPGDPGASGQRNLSASLRRVLATGEQDVMAVLRYDLESTEHPGEWEERYWSPVNSPIFGPDGRITLLVHRVEEVTQFVKARGAANASSAGGLEAELYTRARELQGVNERLRQAHARDREVALSLQKAMLPAPADVGHHRAAVRYQPAVGTLNICGDWYDLVDLPGDRIGVSVGDVVGHGLYAAGVMGLLRSALSAASRVAGGPAEALEVLSLYSRSVEGAECTTAVEIWIDWERHTVTYSSAGHLPPVLLHRGGDVEFLDQATDPPLGASLAPRSRPQAATSFDEGDTLVLYTDGLVERRHEDIDAGLGRLAGSLVRHQDAPTESLADALLLDLLPPGGATDDAALVIVQL